jgi:hypothetical protein
MASAYLAFVRIAKHGEWDASTFEPIVHWPRAKSSSAECRCHPRMIPMNDQTSVRTARVKGGQKVIVDFTGQPCYTTPLLTSE